MDYFGICFDGLCLAGQSIVQFHFVSGLTGKKLKISYSILYFFLLAAFSFLSTRYSFSEVVSIGIGIILLYGMSRLLLNAQRNISWLAAILAFYISQFTFGILDSIEIILFPRWIGQPLLYVLLIAALAVFCLLCTGCYTAVRKLLSLSDDSQTPYIGLLLLPILFFFAAELYILQTSYSTVTSSDFSQEGLGKHSLLLLLQVMGLAALFCTLYAYRQLCQSWKAQIKIQSLTQAAQAQRIYIAEAKIREEQTKSFRHDIKNHLLVLNGLLQNNRLDESKTYLQKLQTISETLSSPYQTGNPIIDILLREKLGLVEDIKTMVSLCLPRNNELDELDLCVIFANALDNAVAACRAYDGEKWISVSGKQQGNFYLLTFQNSCADTSLPPAGTGLKNIQAAVEKYHGAVSIEQAGGRFSLNILLNIS